MKLHTYDEFLEENESGNVLTAQEIVNYITDITPNDSDVPDFFFSQIKKSKKKFIKTKVLIEDILKNDASLKEYVESGEERYGENGDSDIEPDIDDLDLPIVIFNGEVVDGYNRTSVHYHNGDKHIEAYVSQ